MGLPGFFLLRGQRVRRDHAVMPSIAAIALGPWAAVLAVSLALFIQMLLFYDGGVTAFGANCLNMAVLQVMTSVYIWNVLRPADVRQSGKRKSLQESSFRLKGIHAE